MISLNAVTPPENIAFVANFIRLLADPAAAKKRIAEYRAAASELRAANEQLRERQSAFVREQAVHNASLAAATDAHKKNIALAQKQFDQSRLQTENALAAREKRLADAEAQAARDAAENLKMRQDLEHRLSLRRRLRPDRSASQKEK